MWNAYGEGLRIGADGAVSAANLGLQADERLASPAVRMSEGVALTKFARFGESAALPTDRWQLIELDLNAAEVVGEYDIGSGVLWVARLDQHTIGILRDANGRQQIEVWQLAEQGGFDLEDVFELEGLNAMAFFPLAVSPSRRRPSSPSSVRRYVWRSSRAC